MNLDAALASYTGVLFVGFFLMLGFGYTFFAATLLTLIIGLIYLNIAFPMTRSELDDVNSLTVLYSFIQVFTIVVLMFYAVLRVLPQKRSKSKFPMISA